jgi:hypothetical protein
MDSLMEEAFDKWQQEHWDALDYDSAESCGWNIVGIRDAFKAGAEAMEAENVRLKNVLKEIKTNVAELRQGKRGICDGELERIGYLAKQAIKTERDNSWNT